MKSFRILMMVIVAFAMFFQTAVAVNITEFNAQPENNCFRISYSLDADARVESLYSLDGGKTYLLMTHVVGEIGDSVAAGQREFVWNALEEIGNGGQFTITFKLVPTPLGCGTVTDADKNQYSTVVIGKQCWMRENMRSGHSSKGDKITVLPEFRKENSAFAYIPAVDDDSYGYLYNYKAAAQVCPKGWRLPTKGEVKELYSYLGNTLCYSCGENKNAVAKSIASYTGWHPEQEQCLVGQDMATNNASGFNALPAGKNGTDVSLGAYFWTSTGEVVRYETFSKQRNIVFSITSHSKEIEMLESPIENAYSVRCIKDTSWSDDKPSKNTERVKVSIRPEPRNLFIVDVSFPKSVLQGQNPHIDDFSFGFMAGRYKFLGGYFSAMWNGQYNGLFRRQSADMQWTDATKRARISCTAGLIISPIKNINFYVGGGASYNAQLKQTGEGKWFEDPQTVLIGVDVEAGLFFNFGGLALNFGLSTTNFKSMELKAGIGFTSLAKK